MVVLGPGPSLLRALSCWMHLHAVQGCFLVNDAYNSEVSPSSPQAIDSLVRVQAYLYHQSITTP